MRIRTLGGATVTIRRLRRGGGAEGATSPRDTATAAASGNAEGGGEPRKLKKKGHLKLKKKGSGVAAPVDIEVEDSEVEVEVSPTVAPAAAPPVGVQTSADALLVAAEAGRLSGDSGPPVVEGVPIAESVQAQQGGKNSGC